MLYISNALIGKTDPFVPFNEKTLHGKNCEKKCHVYSCNFITR